MKYKVSELEGNLLDAAVAQAEGVKWHIAQTNVGERCIAHWGMAEDHRTFRPTARWQEAGPIIEREHIMIGPTGCAVTADDREAWAWEACTWSGREQHANLPLLAAMRAYVASKFGEEIEFENKEQG